MWNALRNIVTFVLGIVVIIDATFTPGTHITELIVGLVLLGMMPVDQVFERMAIMARIRTAAENHAAQLVSELRANVARLEADYDALQSLLEGVARSISELCQRVNGPHDAQPYDDEATPS